MKLVLNGKEKVVPDSITVEQLLEMEKVEMPEYVTVQRNEQFVDRASMASTTLAEGDQVDFMYFMGGGKYAGEGSR